jgi:hypothetical protein
MAEAKRVPEKDAGPQTRATGKPLSDSVRSGEDAEAKRIGAAEERTAEESRRHPHGKL